MSREYFARIDKKTGKVDFSGVTLKEGETYDVYFDYMLKNHARVVVHSIDEDKAVQRWIGEMILANVDNAPYEREEGWYFLSLKKLAEFVQRRLVAHDPLYPCVEVSRDPEEDDREEHDFGCECGDCRPYLYERSARDAD